MTFIVGFKPVLSYSKPHTFSAVIGEEQEKMIIYSFYPGHFEYEQNNGNDKKVKRIYFCNVDFNLHAIS